MLTEQEASYQYKGEKISPGDEGFDGFESFLISLICAWCCRKGGLERQLFTTTESLNNFSLNT